MNLYGKYMIINDEWIMNFKLNQLTWWQRMNECFKSKQIKCLMETIDELKRDIEILKRQIIHIKNKNEIFEVVCKREDYKLISTDSFFLQDLENYRLEYEKLGYSLYRCINDGKVEVWIKKQSENQSDCAGCEEDEE